MRLLGQIRLNLLVHLAEVVDVGGQTVRLVLGHEGVQPDCARPRPGVSLVSVRRGVGGDVGRARTYFRSDPAAG